MIEMERLSKRLADVIDDIVNAWSQVQEETVKAAIDRFTEQEVEDAKAINRLYDGEIESICRTGNSVWIQSVRYWCQTISGELFPSIKDGENVKLSDIIGG